ncbi:MAG: acetylglutamate kinase [Kiritimatiellae bacterium]|nr:acetylglutamate kinase [Kiritimatiellia bacterium]
MNLQTYIDKASILIEAMPYIQQFRGETFVVKLGGSVMENRDALDSLLGDVAFMATVGIKVVLVHGGGKAISRALDISGVKSEFVMGVRVTSEDAIGIVERVLKKEVNAEIVRMLRRLGANAHPLHGDWIIKAVRKTARPVGSDRTIDWGFVGEPISVDTRTVMEMTDAGVIPVVTPLGMSEFDRIYNINADRAASAVAEGLRARKLAFVSDVPGVLRDKDDPESLISSIRVGDIAALGRDGIIAGGMLPKLQSCAEAIRAGVRKVHLVDGRMRHSLLLEIFTNKGVGTEITEDE